MVKQVEDIIPLIKEETQGFVKWSREYSKRLKALVLGHDFVEFLIRIDHLENEQKIKARKKFAHSIKDTSSRLLKHLDNIYSSTGGVKIYDYPETFQAEVIGAISNLIGNTSLEKWLHSNWCEKAYHTDPAGLIMLEWKNEKVYPVYKSIFTIKNYEAFGQNVEWVLFEPKELNKAQILKIYGIELAIENNKKVKVHRYIDAENDWHIIEQNKEFKELNKYPVPFKQCPAVINSDIIDIETGFRLSPLDGVSEILEEILRDKSIQILYKVQHGIPQFWRVATRCQVCNGTGKSDNKECPDCQGKGLMPRKDITDEIKIPLNQDGTIPNIQKAMGWETPPLDVWDKYNHEEKLLDDKLNKTHWGTVFIEGQDETFRGKKIDRAPMEKKLDKYAKVAEWVEWQLSEWIAKYVYPAAEKNKIVISYGRRYILESPDELLETYVNSLKEKANSAILDQQLREYITAKYKNDIETLSEMLTRIENEPYIHFSISDVKDIFGNNEAMKKALFNDYWVLGAWRKAKDIKADYDKWFTERQSSETKEQTPLAISLGVGGTQAFQLIVTDRFMNAETKKNVLKVLFGLNDEQVDSLQIPETANQIETPKPAEPVNQNILQ